MCMPILLRSIQVFCPKYTSLYEQGDSIIKLEETSSLHNLRVKSKKLENPSCPNGKKFWLFQATHLLRNMIRLTFHTLVVAKL